MRAVASIAIAPAFRQAPALTKSGAPAMTTNMRARLTSAWTRMSGARGYLCPARSPAILYAPEAPS